MFERVCAQRVRQQLNGIEYKNQCILLMLLF